MRTAILSGIHANLPALKAVAADARARGAERFVCLGNTTGGGPHPVETARWVRDHCAWHLRGQMEIGLVFDPYMEGWSTLIMVDSIHWARREFQRHPEGAALLEWVAGAPEEAREGRIWFQPFLRCFPSYAYLGGVERTGWLSRLRRFALGTTPTPPPRLSDDDVRAYADRDQACYREVKDQFDACIGGFSFYSGIVWQWGSAKHERLLPPEIELAGSLLVLVGNVGLPRDGDPRASYAIMEAGRLTFHRVDYDVGAFAAATALSSLHPATARWLTKWRRGA